MVAANSIQSNASAAMATFEDVLEHHADADGTRFFQDYSLMKDRLERDYYPWIQANCPYFTDHGQNHVASVIEKAYSIIGEKRVGDLSALEIYLLLTAIIWHDVGMVLVRTDHQDAVRRVIEGVRGICFNDVQIQGIVEEIVKAHSGITGLDAATIEVDCTTPSQATCTISPRNLAAVVRFADEISETRRRINPEIIDQVPATNRLYWEYSNCISAARPDAERERVVITLSIDLDTAATEFPCSQFVDRSQDGNISLIEYIVLRLEKMNNERFYCATQSGGMVPLYRTIEARMEWKRGPDELPDYEKTVFFSDLGLSEENKYPIIDCFDDFFNANPKYRPDQLRLQ